MPEKKCISSWWQLVMAVSFVLLSLATGQAKTIEYHLEIASQPVDITGKPTTAMTINGSIPGPVLRFREGDLARIHVSNRMDVETSIHWHGILVPPGMDGVPNISFPPIAPGATFTYEFPIRQSGTYWYHSHSGLQEQRGVYGSIVIEPPVPRFQPDRDYVLLLSDWTDEDPHQVLRTLKRGSEWFALEKGSAQSIFGAARLGMLSDYFKRELQRMPAMDIADVAYDRFLANGSPETHLDARPGETIRLRIIDGSSTTFFHIQFAGGPMRIMAADGQDVEPVETPRFLIGVAETYDVLVTVPPQGAYELRATSHDGSGFASVWFGHGDSHAAPEVPKPNLYHTVGDLSLDTLFALTPEASMGMGDDAVTSSRFDQPGMMAMGGMHGMGHGMEMMDKPGMPGMDHGAGSLHMGHAMKSPPAPMTRDRETADAAEHGAGHAGHNMMDMADMPGMNREQQKMTGNQGAGNGIKYAADFRPMASDVASAGSLAMDGMDPNRPWPPYDRLRATRSTAFAGDRPVREIRLTLDGDMERYVWFINNKALSETDCIPIRQGEIVRFIMINRTMMHHPMHLHGHFFRVINGQGDHAPLKHTVDVAPMSTTVIEFDANEVGDWFFHCHLLYHMVSGMARLVHYENFVLPEAVAAVRPQLYQERWYFWGEAELSSNMTEGFIQAADTRNTIAAEWQSGWEQVDKNEWEGLFYWDRYINRFFTLFAGLDMLGAGSVTEHSRGVLGITWLLPLNIESRFWLDTDRGGRFAFAKAFTLTPRLALLGETEYDTHDSKWESKAGLTYTLSKSFSLIGQWQSDFGWGGGIIIRF
ncbi:MAG: multicopper oxidase domain-containing protein [Proteobacteria bacterium]|nr:multicopper oxidase domain-containing protein [Pseudomonadota bacterium]